MSSSNRRLAVVTGAATGIGLELARCCAGNGYDLVISADDPEIHEAAGLLMSYGAHVTAVVADLSKPNDVERVLDAVEGRDVDALLANAEYLPGEDFLDQDFDKARHVIASNVTGMISLVHTIARGMRSRGAGRILFTGMASGLIPGVSQAICDGTKAFMDAFSNALREELRNSGVNVTCLIPGTPEASTHYGMPGTWFGSDRSDDLAHAARAGFEAALKGERSVNLSTQARR